jgi:hypothetical protein
LKDTSNCAPNKQNCAFVSGNLGLDQFRKPSTIANVRDSVPGTVEKMNRMRPVTVLVERNPPLVRSCPSTILNLAASLLLVVVDPPCPTYCC